MFLTWSNITVQNVLDLYFKLSKWLKQNSSSERECILKMMVLGTTLLITWSSCRSPGNCSQFFPGKQLFWRHQHIPEEYCLFLTLLAWYLKDHIETCRSFQWLKNNAAGFTISHNGLLQWKKVINLQLGRLPVTGIKELQGRILPAYYGPWNYLMNLLHLWHAAEASVGDPTKCFHSF